MGFGHLPDGVLQNFILLQKALKPRIKMDEAMGKEGLQKEETGLFLTN